ncbi:hypothetical protein H072_2345 [Dactylellina haptotyla CBS 200.50]|uniref:Uncharacterized protein n=1 Tax=Dactylellina haptotyla (strain CBS 200.50) TaxID=1284197 RepID=S8C7G7_DACHA|nr:hypothetical protein H072_2345 [Dactylellina haptotyla CBS 200.50]
MCRKRVFYHCGHVEIKWVMKKCPNLAKTEICAKIVDELVSTSVCSSCEAVSTSEPTRIYAPGQPVHNMMQDESPDQYSRRLRLRSLVQEAAEIAISTDKTILEVRARKYRRFQRELIRQRDPWYDETDTVILRDEKIASGGTSEKTEHLPGPLKPTHKSLHEYLSPRSSDTRHVYMPSIPPTSPNNGTSVGIREVPSHDNTGSCEISSHKTHLHSPMPESPQLRDRDRDEPEATRNFQILHGTASKPGPGRFSSNETATSTLNTSLVQIPNRDPEKRFLEPGGIPLSSDFTSNGPRHYFSDYIPPPRSSSKRLPSKTMATPRMSSSHDTMRPTPLRSCTNVTQEDSWERLNTLADMAIATDLARKGDQELSYVLEAARRYDSESREFRDSNIYLSNINFDHTVRKEEKSGTHLENRPGSRSRSTDPPRNHYEIKGPKPVIEQEK